MLAYSAGAPHTGAVEGQCVVYARWNMENDVAYVGETEKFATRVGQHYMKTLAHGEGRKCTGCSEQHAKYLKHRPVAAALWLMTPVRICASKTEARLLERKIERIVDPELNRMARKYPSEHNYVMLERKQNRERRAANKQRTAVNWRTRSDVAASMDRHDMTSFTVDGTQYLSLESLLEEREGRSVGSVLCHVGTMMAGTWRRVRQEYGETQVSTAVECVAHSPSG